MARRKQTKGKCAFCGRAMTRGGLTRHLTSCEARQAAIQAADKQGKAQQTIHHLQVQDAGWGGYWLHLEMNGTASLKELDCYLRAIWLECCGHMSQFSIGGWRGAEIPMGKRVDDVFEPGVELVHIYDFGTSSETLIKAVGVRQGSPLGSRPIALMARNDPPEAFCATCGQPAAFLCMECIYEHEQDGLLCEAHAKGHLHDDYGEPIPLVNSPRVGLCGYDGPAKPPY